jgi:hypothetical protein
MPERVASPSEGIEGPEQVIEERCTALGGRSHYFDDHDLLEAGEVGRIPGVER